MIDKVFGVQELVYSLGSKVVKSLQKFCNNKSMVIVAYNMNMIIKKKSTMLHFEKCKR